MKRNYYEVLGVAKSATSDEIKNAYRGLAKKYHPDRNNGSDKAQAEIKFKEASEAYETLSDDNKRRNYDGMNSGFNPFENFFNAMHSGFSTAKMQVKGDDVEVIYVMDIKDLFNESSHTIKYKRSENCTTCSGSGVKSGCQKQRCVVCNGSGKTSKQSMSHGIHHVAFAMCDVCSGQGFTTKKEDKCQTCDGEGTSEEEASISFKVPMGMPLGKALAFQNQGGIGINNGPRGDLYIKIVSDDSCLKPNPNNPAEILYDLRIPYWKAVLGCEERILLPKGNEATITIPPFCKGGTSKRVDKEGLPIFGRSDRGDLVIIYNIDVPDDLSDQMKVLIENMRDLEKSHDGEES